MPVIFSVALSLRLTTGANVPRKPPSPSFALSAFAASSTADIPAFFIALSVWSSPEDAPSAAPLTPLRLSFAFLVLPDSSSLTRKIADMT